MDQTNDLLNQTTKIVVSHLSNNVVPADRLPNLIRDVYTTLTGLDKLPVQSPQAMPVASQRPILKPEEPIKAVLPKPKPEPEPAEPKLAEGKPNPAVPITRSVFPDYLVCLEDGKRLVMMKRHLRTSYKMTPDEYRERWGLPPSYPMIAPNYFERRAVKRRQQFNDNATEIADEDPLPREPEIEPLSGSVIRRIPEGLSGRKLAKLSARKSQAA